MNKIAKIVFILSYPILALAGGENKDYIPVQHPDGKIEIGVNVKKPSKKDHSSSPRTSTTFHAAPSNPRLDQENRRRAEEQQSRAQYEQYVQQTRIDNASVRSAMSPDTRANFMEAPVMNFGQWRHQQQRGHMQRLH